MQQNVLLTGASSGIGNAILELLAKNNFKIFATVRKIEDKEKIEKLNDNIKCYIADLTNEKDIERIENEIKADAKHIDIIINNAGVAYTNILEAANLDVIREQFEINTFAPLRIIKAFLPLMDAGKIINISSISSNIVYPFISPYCASKRSLDIFFQALNIEINNPKIKIVSIKPATIKTPIWDKSHKIAQNNFENLPSNIQNKYKDVLRKLLKSSKLSAQNGIDVSKVAKLVLKIIQMKNPKMSYCVGITSHISVWFSRLPIELQTKISQAVLKMKLKVK